MRKSSVRTAALAAAVCVCVHAAPAITPLGTEFTYQGRLKNSGSPANGRHDMRFRLYRELTGGSQIGETLCANDVSVTDGLFTLPLDFGAPFAGEELFLEIDVRPETGLDCASAAGFSVLSPRQPLTASPNAHFAVKAATATNATTAANAIQLNGRPAAFYQDASSLVSGTLADARLSSNAAMLNNAQSFTGAKTFSLAPSFAAAGPPFSVASNSLVLNLNADRLDGLDSTAFLQSNPVPFTLSGTNATHIIRAENASANTGAAAIVGVSTAATGVNYAGRFETTSTTGRAVYGSATAASGSTYGGQFLSSSTDGRGLFASATALTGDTDGGRLQSSSTSGTGVCGIATAPTGNTYGGRFQSSSITGTGVYALTTADTGGTYGVYGQSDSVNGVGVHGRGRHGVTGSATEATGYGGVFGGSGIQGAGRALLVSGDSEFLGSADFASYVDFSGSVEIAGELGIGTGNPAVKLQVVGGTDTSPGGGGYLVTGSTAGTNICIDDNEIMARNNGQVAPLLLNNNGGDVVVGGSLDINYTIVTNYDCVNGVTEVLCPAGLKVIGGGCDGVRQEYLIEQSYPLPGGNGWYCRTNNWVSIFSDGCHDNDPPGVGTFARAICANVK